jgi:SAM-dependent methyltransferase
MTGHSENADAVGAFLDIFRETQDGFLSLSASKTTNHTQNSAVHCFARTEDYPAGCLRVKVKPVNKGYYAEMFTKTQVFHRTLSQADFPVFLEALCGAFGNIVFRYKKPDEDYIRIYTLIANNKGKLRLLETRERVAHNTQGAVPAHNSEKNYILQTTGAPISFLVHLGIMTDVGKIIAAKQGKFRQINRFLEYVDDILPRLNSHPLSVVDFGCGSSYLTFALYYFLTELRGIPTHITGIDVKEDVIAHCTELAAKLGYADGLSFRAESIEQFASEADTAMPDLLVTLHACDTATDYALAYGIRRKVPAILSVPCCQHELNALLRPNAVPAMLSPLVSHGLLKERFAALATDAIRVRLLENAGYAVTVSELVTAEDTPKNLLIRGVLKPHSPAAETLPKDLLSETLGVSLTLERELARR